MYASLTAPLLFALTLCCATVNGAPSSRKQLNASTPVVIWHGFGDRFDNPAFAGMLQDIQDAIGSDTYIHVVRLADDGSADSKASLFGDMREQVQRVAKELSHVTELKDDFDAIGLSQGGVYLRALVELHSGRHGVPKVRNLITLGSPHMGIASAPLCSAADLLCKTAAWALKAGAWTSYAQNNIIPAQYFRSQDHIDEYLSHSSILRDLNNERANDTQPVLSGLETSDDNDDDVSPRNETYKKAITSLNNLVLFNFDLEANVIPTTSPWFTLPADHDNPHEPMPWMDLPLYRDDYIGLRALDKEGGLHRQTCHGPHMNIDKDCWQSVIAWLGDNGKGRGLRTSHTVNSPTLILQSAQL